MKAAKEGPEDSPAEAETAAPIHTLVPIVNGAPQST
jgi:hypothetical protein